MTLDELIQQAFSATQIILVFLSILFGIRYQEINDLLSEQIPSNSDARKEFKNRVKKVLIEKCLVLIVVIIIIFLMFTPILIEIGRSSFQYLWTTRQIVYNFTQASFVIISSMIFGLFLWSVIKTFDVFKFYNKI